MKLVRSEDSKFAFYNSNDKEKKPYWALQHTSMSFNTNKYSLNRTYNIIRADEDGLQSTAILSAELHPPGEAPFAVKYLVLEEDGEVRKFDGEFRLEMHKLPAGSERKEKAQLFYHADSEDYDTGDNIRDTVFVSVLLPESKFEEIISDIASRKNPIVGVSVATLMMVYEVEQALYDPLIHSMDAVVIPPSSLPNSEERKTFRSPGSVLEFSIHITEGEFRKSQKQIDLEYEKQLQSDDGNDFLGFKNLLNDDQEIEPATTEEGRYYKTMTRQLRYIFWVLVVIAVILLFQL